METIPVQVIESYMVSPELTEATTGVRMLEVDNPLLLTAGQYYKVLVTSDDVIHS